MLSRLRFYLRDHKQIRTHIEPSRLHTLCPLKLNGESEPARDGDLQFTKNLTAKPWPERASASATPRNGPTPAPPTNARHPPKRLTKLGPASNLAGNRSTLRVWGPQETKHSSTVAFFSNDRIYIEGMRRPDGMSVDRCQ